MAVPSAVTRKREQQEAALRAQGIDPNAPPTAVLEDELQTPAPTPTPTAPVTNGHGGDTEAQLRARIAELEAEVRTSGGRSSTAQSELDRTNRALEAVQENRQFLERTLQELQDKNEAQQRELEELRRQTTQSTTDRALSQFTDAPDPTPQELATFGEDTVTFVGKVARKQLAAAITPLLDRLKVIEGALSKLKDLDKLPVLEKTLAAQATTAEQRAERDFMDKEVFAFFPDFEKVRDTDAWKAYLNREVPGRGMKVGHLLTHYHANRNAVGVRAVLTTFYDEQKAAPTRDSLAVPGKANTEGTPHEKPRLRASEYQVKLRQFINKKLSKADWDAYKAEFDQALLDGRVDRDAPI